MKKTIIYITQLLCVSLLYINSIVAQHEELLLIFQEENNFYKIQERTDAFFAKTYPGKTPYVLSTGMHRDGKYVKYQRWTEFWRSRLNPDGTLADLSKFNIKKRKQRSGKRVTNNDSLAWTQISYEVDKGVQIGLGRTSAMAFHPTDPNTFYVGAAIGGVWKTTNGGYSYTPIGDELPFLAVSSLIVNQNNPNTIYAAISDRVWYGPSGIGIWKTTDDGATWNPTSFSINFAENKRIYWMAADPNNPNKMFVATEKGLYVTTDAFATNSLVTDGKVTDVKFKPGDSNTIYYVKQDNSGFYRATDGISFSLVSTMASSGYMRLATSHNYPNLVYVNQGNNLHKSSDSGSSFYATSSLSAAGVGDGIAMISPLNQNDIFAGNFDMYRSSNGGSSFTQISHWLGSSGLPLIHVDQRNAFTNPLQDDRIYLCNDGGVYFVNVTNNQFTNLSNGLIITQFYDISTAQSNNNVMAGGSQDNGNVFRDVNGDWDRAQPTADGMTNAIDPTDHTIKYNSYQNGSIFRFEGSTEIDISGNIPGNVSGQGEWVTPFVLDPNNPSRLVIAYDRVYESFNRGNSWSSISTQLANGSDMDYVKIAPSDSEKIYVIENYGKGTGGLYGTGQYDTELFVKNSDNDSWTTISLPFDEAVEDIEIDFANPSTLLVCLSGYVDGQKVFKSTDGGNNWTNISGSLPNAPATALVLYEKIDGAIFVGTDAGVFYRNDNMTDWEEYAALPHTYIRDLEIQKAAGLLRAGTHGRGIYEISLPNNLCESATPPDADGDGVCDDYDICPGGDDTVDTDSDGIPDACEPCGYGVLDSDGDGVCDGDDICPGGDDTVDTDSDGIPDACEPCGYGVLDSDGDGVCDGDDICPGGDDNMDTDSDGIPDFCEPCGFEIGDSDGDGVCDNVDICPGGDDHVDLNNNGVPDFCEAYCDAEGSAGTGADYINKVVLNMIDNASDQTPYSDFTNISTELESEQSYPLSITLNYSFEPDVAYAWIDYNQNRVFDASEAISMSAFDGNHTSNGTVTIPTTALSGSTVLRVRCLYADPQPADPACGSYYGEVEDYTVVIAIACEDQVNPPDSDNDGVCDEDDICSGGDDNIDSDNDGIPDFCDTYCTAAGSAGTGSDYINNVVLNAISNPSGQSPYSDFTNITIVLELEQSYTLSITLQDVFELDAAYAWIDFNQNKTFESTESVSMSAFDANNTSSGAVSVPATALLGNTVLRVRCLYADPQPENPACGDFYGEVEDYTVILGTGCNNNDIILISPNDDMGDGAMDHYETSQNILATNKITGSADINYDVGVSILLNAGFEVQAGATFHAYIDGCQ